jgi:hypothetical protein
MSAVTAATVEGAFGDDDFDELFGDDVPTV